MFKKKLRCNFTGDFSQIMYALSCWQAYCYLSIMPQTK